MCARLFGRSLELRTVYTVSKVYTRCLSEFTEARLRRDATKEVYPVSSRTHVCKLPRVSIARSHGRRTSERRRERNQFFPDARESSFFLLFFLSNSNVGWRGNTYNSLIRMSKMVDESAIDCRGTHVDDKARITRQIRVLVLSNQLKVNTVASINYGWPRPDPNIMKSAFYCRYR